MTAETVSAVAAVLISLAIAYVPGLRARFQALSSTGKRVALLAALALVPLAAFGAACTPQLAGLLPAGLAGCSQPGAMELVRAFALAVVANQTTYVLTGRRSAA
jgi:hypothetical protein